VDVVTLARLGLVWLASPLLQRAHSAPRTAGEGAFGVVRLVRHAPTGALYALKAMAKARVVATKQTRNVVHERALMEALDHPFLLRLVGATQDEECLYLLLEYCGGGDLFNTLLRAGGVVDVPAARWYTAAAASALSYLHDVVGVAYRDLKPENLLLDAEGVGAPRGRGVRRHDSYS
jgi:protein kinase A